VDIIFAEPGSPEVANVNSSNCFNSSDIGFNNIFSQTSTVSGAEPSSSLSAFFSIAVAALAVAWSLN
jgi:hypothetical protein